MSESHGNSAIVHATESDFDEIVARRSVVLVKFGAAWCPPCRMMGPYIELFARQYAEQALVVEVDTDHAKGLKQRFGVSGIPHVILLRNGEAGGEFVGFAGDIGIRKQARALILGENASEELSQSELDFAAAALLAEAAFKAADEVAEASPENQALEAAWKPHGDAYKAAVEAAAAELEAKTIDQETHDQRVAAAVTAARAAQQTEEFKTLIAAYKQVGEPGEKTYIGAIAAAVDQFFPLASPAPTTTTGEDVATTSGAICALGDESCRS
jgi:thioredoxin 1